MNPTFSRILKALCTLAAIALLSACGGASSTVEPFNPTRVVGLGDGYNDATATVRVAGSTTGSVVGQVAAYFGQSNVVSQAAREARIADLANQITAVGSFTAGDLVVITVGAFDVKAGADAANEAQTLVTQVQRLLSAGVKHVLIMPVLELSRTPWGRATTFDPTATPSASLTNSFNSAVLSALTNAFGGQMPNQVIYANVTNLAPTFLTATSVATFSSFTDTGYNGTAAGTTPACGAGSATSFAGCVAGGVGVSTSYTTMLFADGVHLTPLGNQWIAQFLYNATRIGSWR
jgi:phospholipase/lecithinase/hemolysin